MSVVNQKEYLKKYLGIGKHPGDKKKKRKKDKKKPPSDRLKIIDDDLEVSISQEIQDDLTAENEDAPQVVAVIDERPLHLQVDERTKQKLWEPIGQSDGWVQVEGNGKEENETRQGTPSPPKRNDLDVGWIKKERKSLSPSRNDRNLSPPMRKDAGSKKPSKGDRKRAKEKKLTPSPSPPPKKSYSIEDLSPARSRRNDGDSKRTDIDDLSPVRRKDTLEDLSPVRKRSRKSLSPRKRKGDTESKTTGEDLSPIRRLIKRESTTSPLPRNKDLSPPRRKDSFEDLSPIRRRIKKEPVTSPSHKDTNNTKRDRAESTSSSSRNSHSDRSKKRSRWEDRSPEPKQHKTLGGKKAGLQNAGELIVEIAAAKEREDRVFRSLTEEQSGRNATTVVRNQKQEDPEEEARKLEKEREVKEKYNRWGKGLKQVEDDDRKFADEQYEMTKPLARYADDEDLERYLKEQEREGDPMLDYIRKKKKKKVVEDGIPEKPTYLGEFMPNRFGIRPGYRWDGVDRSNGYEKKYFEVQNARRAVQEDTFKWSTEDM